MSVIATLALWGPAHAFAPAPSTGPNLEPQRVQWLHGETQGVHLASPAWRRFASGVGRDWQARFDEGTGTPLWMWGRGIPVPTGSERALTDALARLIGQHGDLIGVGAGELSLRSARYSAKYDTWYVQFDALRAGLPTYRGGISARVKHGNLVLLQVATAPDAPVTGERVIDSYAAVAAAIQAGPAPRAVHTERLAEPQLLLRQTPHGLELRQTWMTRTRTQDPPGIWVSFVDAADGRLLSVHNEVRFVNGNVSAEHHVRNASSGFTVSPVVDAFVDSGVDDDQTDANGDYTVTTTGSYTTSFDGDYVYVNDASGTDAEITSGNANITWTDNDATQAEIDTYVFTHHVRDWAAAVEPSVTQVSYGQLTANVNINSACNAYYDGNSINFFDPGSVYGTSCTDTGEIADVVYHEWGHGFHAFSLLAGGFDGSLSEGAADTVAFLQTGDPVIGPGFYTNGGGIRNVSPDQVYPQDYSTNPNAVHSNGLIFGGSMWDLWDLLVDDYGTGPGTDITEDIFAGLLKGGTDIPGTYFEALVADDDDGDLANGTPHACQISEAFGRHGLGEQIGGASFITTHLPLSIEDANVAVPVEVEVSALSADCESADPEGGTVHYRVDGGAWQAVAANVAGSSVIGEIPAQPLGRFVEYWMEGTDSEGGSWQAPFSGEYAPYSYFVGGVIQVSCEDFEASDGGFQHELVSGDIQDGADDWQWGTPFGQNGDPAAAYSGDNVWGNDLGIDGFNGQYQPDKVNRLWSPPIDTLWYTDVFLAYQRWLNVEDSTYDRGVITANGVEVWENHGSSAADEHHQERQWVSHAVDLQGLADQTTVEIGWELHSDGGLEFGGWTIDDVCVYAPLNADNRLAIVDFVVEDQGGPIGLSWTNPEYQPVERVVVTRRTDRYPEAWDDGDLLIDVPAPVAGEPVEAVHGNVDGASGYYAVYGYDGAEWLSWTIEGWNAGFAAPNEGGTTDVGTGTTGTIDDTTPTGSDPLPEDVEDGKDEAGGCACDSAGGPSGAVLVAAIALLAARRRRR